MTSKKNKRKKVLVEPDENRVNLSSVNKASKNGTKKNIFNSRIFKNKPGQKRDDEGKFTSGSGGLKAVKKLNWGRAIPLVLVIALVGGGLVYRTFAGTAEDVTVVFQEVLGRNPDTSGWYYWTDRLNKGMTINQLRAELKNTAEYKNKQSAAAKPASPQQPTQAASNAPAATQASPATMPAKKYGYGRSASPDPACTFRKGCEDALANIYHKLLGREPDSSTKYWVDQIIDWGKTTSDVEAAIKTTTEYKNRQIKLSSEAKQFTGSNAKESDAMFIARACLEVFLVDCHKEDALSGAKNSFEKQFYDLLKSGKSREEVYKQMVQSGFGGYRTATHRNDTSAKTASAEQRKTWNDFMYNLYMEMTGGVAGNPEGQNGLPYRGDLCEREVSAYKDKTIMYFDHTGICFNTAGGAFDVEFYNKWRNGELTLDQISNIIKSGEKGKLVMTCSEALAAAIPECGGGAISVPVDRIDQILEEKKASRNEKKKAETTPSSSDNSQIKAPSAKATKPSDLPKNSSEKTRQINKPKSALDIAVANTPNKSLMSAPTSLQKVAYNQVILSKVSEIESSVVDSIVFSDCFGLKEDLKEGDEGECVSYVQESMGLLGNTNLPVTGYYDYDTKIAVSKFQKQRNIKSAAGKVDKNTMELVVKAVTPTRNTSPYSPARGSLVNNR